MKMGYNLWLKTIKHPNLEILLYFLNNENKTIRTLELLTIKNRIVNL